MFVNFHFDVLSPIRLNNTNSSSPNLFIILFRVSVNLYTSEFTLNSCPWSYYFIFRLSYKKLSLTGAFCLINILIDWERSIFSVHMPLLYCRFLLGDMINTDSHPMVVDFMALPIINRITVAEYRYDKLLQKNIRWAR